MLLGSVLALTFAQTAAPATPARETQIQSALSIAAQKFGPTTGCEFPRENPSDFLAVIGGYEGGIVPTVTVAGQDNDTSLANIAIAKGTYPVYLVLSSYDPVIWRIIGDVKRVRQVLVGQHQGAGVIGIPKRKVSFVDGDKCRLPWELYPARSWEHEVPILAIFGRRANVIGGRYTIFSATIDDSSVKVAPPEGDLFKDLVALEERHASELEKDFRRHFPAGITSIDPRQVVASGIVERYEILPKTAGALQLERSGAIVPASAADIRRWKDRAVIGGHVRADRIDDLDFYSAYRVTRPIRLPAGLCGGYSLTLFVPSRDYVKGDPCHSNIYVDDGTIMAGVSSGD